MSSDGSLNGSSVRRVLCTIGAVVIGLALIDAWVRGPFWAQAIKPTYVDRSAVLADHTGGLQLNILFDALARSPRQIVRIAFIGDSTMQAVQYPERARVPMKVRTALRGRFPEADIDAVDVSFIGLYTSDAALLIAKLLAGHVDVIVYGLALRALPRHPSEYWATSISSELDPGTIARIVRSGGLGWLVANVSGEQLSTGVVTTAWATYAYRTKIWNVLADRLTALVPMLPITRYTLGKQLPVGTRPEQATFVDWPRDTYGPPSANWTALDVIGELCGTYAPGRCLLYAVPVNPEGRDRLTERGFYGEFLERAREVAEHGHMRWLDLSDALVTGDFHPPQFAGRSRDPIHLNPTGLAKLAGILADPVARIAREVLGEKSGEPR